MSGCEIWRVYIVLQKKSIYQKFPRKILPEN